MARANRHHLPGYVWHITHRCHKKEFLLKFEKDKKRWISWLFEAKKRFGLCVLDYTVTSNVKRGELANLLGIKDQVRMMEVHRQWVETLLKNGSNKREAKWSESIAVGDKEGANEIFQQTFWKKTDLCEAFCAAAENAMGTSYP